MTEARITMDIDLKRANEQLLEMDALDRMQWTADTFGEGAVLISSMQKTSSVIMHLFHRLGLDNEILFVDTGFHFHQTLTLRDQFMRRYSLNLLTIYPQETPEQQEERFGCKLYKSTDGQPICCYLRKVKPFIDHMKVKGRTAVLGGLRRSEGGARARLDAIAEDLRFGGYRIHPLVDWEDGMVEAYLADHDVPVNPLHHRCYPSIGCQCCTTAVSPGEDVRAGRWRHLREGGGAKPVFCGMNFSEAQPVPPQNPSGPPGGRGVRRGPARGA